MENLKGFMYSTKAIGSVGLDNAILFKHYNNSFWLLWIHFDHGQNKIQIFNFWTFPIYMGSEVMMGFEDTLKIFFKGQICSKGVKWNMFWLWPIWN